MLLDFQPNYLNMKIHTRSLSTSFNHFAQIGTQCNVVILSKFVGRQGALITWSQKRTHLCIKLNIFFRPTARPRRGLHAFLNELHYWSPCSTFWKKPFKIRHYPIRLGKYISKFLNFQLLKMPWFIGGKKKSEFLNSTRPCLSALEFLKKIQISTLQ